MSHIGSAHINSTNYFVLLDNVATHNGFVTRGITVLIFYNIYLLSDVANNIRVKKNKLRQKIFIIVNFDEETGSSNHIFLDDPVPTTYTPTCGFSNFHAWLVATIQRVYFCKGKI